MAAYVKMEISFDMVDSYISRSLALFGTRPNQFKFFQYFFENQLHVAIVKTAGKLDNQTGQILGKAIVSVDDHYIVLLDIPTEEHLAVVITEHCLEEI